MLVAGFACLCWAMHKTITRVGIGMRLDGTYEYSFDQWTVGTYFWAAAGGAAAGIIVWASIRLVTGQVAEKSRHGFPVR